MEMALGLRVCSAALVLCSAIVVEAVAATDSTTAVAISLAGFMASSGNHCVAFFAHETREPARHRAPPHGRPTPRRWQGDVREQQDQLKTDAPRGLAPGQPLGIF